jgi:pimeloyl-ACP methyl ester carboxylesterase
MTLFALVHGAWHGAWCWDKLIPELHARGHRTVAMDMPITDGGVSVDGYINSVVQPIEAARDGDDVTIVGHSMAGVIVPFAADAVQPKRLVYLGALLPKPGRPVAETFSEPGMVADLSFGQIDNGDGSSSWKKEEAIDVFYHDCSRADGEWAFERLRPQNWALAGLTLPDSDLKRWPSTYIVCNQDKTVVPDWSRRSAPDVLGVDPIEIEGSHSPFLSRPAELAEMLVSLN